VGAATVDLLLGDVHSLKEKRGVVRPLIADLKRYGVAVAEVGHQDLHRRTLVGISCVSGESAQCGRELDACLRAVEDRPEVTVVAVHRAVVTVEDLTGESDGAGER
jgi:uncharacterized protein YlxP (DUF503 family)